MRFLGQPAADDPFALVNNSLLQLHDRECADRVERFEELLPHLANTRCAAACAQLANRSLPGPPPPEKRGPCGLCVEDLVDVPQRSARSAAAARGVGAFAAVVVALGCIT